MRRRLAPLVAASLALLTVAACVASAGSTLAPSAPSPAVHPTPVRVPLITPAPTVSPDAGNVDGVSYPELTIEPVDATTIEATIEDPAAKAWRLVIAGTGARAGDRLELVVETSDVEPSILAREIRDGRLVDEIDLTGYADGTAAAGGCHRMLPVCVDSDGFRLPVDGDGTFSVRLTVTDAGTPLTVTGGTATWPEEPFVLGPWTDAEPFPWNQR